MNFLLRFLSTVSFGGVGGRIQRGRDSGRTASDKASKFRRRSKHELSLLTCEASSRAGPQ